MKKFQHYLRGTKYPIIVKSDHRNLRTSMPTKELNARQARWAKELSSYNFIIEHIEGKENTVADALSRRHDYKDDSTPARTSEQPRGQIFKETEQGLVINKNIEFMISIGRDEEGLSTTIKNATRK